jgi:hypothetical protein
MMGARCVVCTVRPPRATEGRKRACDVCSVAIYNMLADICTYSAFLRILLEPGRMPTNTPVGKPGDASPAPVRVDVLALLADTGDMSITGVLGPYVEATVTGRRLSGADHLAAPELLRRHVDWIIEQPWLEVAAADIRRIHRSVRAVCGEAVSVVARHDECGGRIVASTWTDEATCTGCGASWPRNRWRELGARQRQEARV